MSSNDIPKSRVDGDKPEILVRLALHDDLEDLARLFDQYRVFQGQASDPAAGRAFLCSRLDQKESILFLAFERDEAVGLAQLYPSFSSVALAKVFILNDLFVVPQCRRRGVATFLLSAVERYAWSLSATRVTLNVDALNHKGIALYEAMGWCRDSQYLMYHRFNR
jgi:GNAT superfamily N-acetyltransferase